MWHSVEDSQPRPKQGSDPCFSKDGLVILKESDARVGTQLSWPQWQLRLLKVSANIIGLKCRCAERGAAILVANLKS